ncbi:MAG TPA: glycosyl transferase [Elusimicrobia bacterium]|nr:glycosyl transferase [Elusimicrobiota bacterium]HBT60845.1 glycosyl transferase [Elusimicrobiota bacterium]
MKVTVLIPVYNERWTLRELMRRVYEQSELLHEVVAVDDGSTDGSAAQLRELEVRYGSHRVPLRAVYRDGNGGKGAALLAGLRRVTGDVVVIQDADLEYNPKEYADLIAPLLDGRADVVYGSRFFGGAPRRVLFFWHSVANRLLTTWCNLFSGLNLTDVWTGYKVFPAALLRRLDLRSSGFGFEPEVTIKIARLGCRIYEVPIGYEGRTYEEGKKIRFQDAVTGTLAMIRAWLSSSQACRSSGEHTLHIMARAGRYNRLLFEQIEPHLGREVIEVGAGIGNISRMLLDRDRLVLTDMDSGYVSMLQRAYQGWGYVQAMRLDLVNPGSSPEIDRLWGSFDTVVCFQVLEHVQDDVAALRAMRRLLKPGGRVLLMLPAHQRLFGTLDQELSHLRRYDAADARRKLAEAGFEVEALRFYNPLAVPGWWLNGRVLKRRLIPDLQLAIFDRLCFLVRALARFELSFGLVIYAQGLKKPD